MKKIDIKIDTWKNKLLDLGKRNRLINYKETKRSSFQITFPDIFILWNILVKKEKTIEFPYFDEYSLDLDEPSGAIKTNQSIKDMQATLRNLRDKAKTAKEEQGTNILYLSFGFLKWKESANSDIYFYSPIILVPVNLTIESIVSPYKLSLHEDEIVINPTLRYKLENDFNIKLPEFNEEGDIESYFKEAEKLIERNNWEIIRNTSLSLLSFLKINMYDDLVKHKNEIKKNSIIRQITGDTTLEEIIPEDIINFDFDKILTPDKVFQVVDADSSQQDAILYAKKGISFILQGPPGTGKSQTITNIISECLADGKKVLFVSEKMAALEVVHNRLTKSELNDFCLILHSHKTSKKVVLDQLEKVLKMAEKKVQLNDEIYLKLMELQKYKDKLNDYSEQISVKVPPLGKSIFEVNGILSHLDKFDDIIFGIKNVEKTTKEQYNKQLYLLNQLSSTIGKLTEDYSLNPWKGSSVHSLTNELRHDIKATFSLLISNIGTASDKANEIYNNLSIKWINSFSGWKSLKYVLDIAKQSPIVPIQWMKSIEIDSFLDDIKKYEQLKSRFFEKLSDINQSCEIIKDNDDSIVNLSTNNLFSTANIEIAIEKIKNYLSQSPYCKWGEYDEKIIILSKLAEEQSIKINEIHNIITSQFEEGIFTIDFKEIYNRYKTDYTSFFKVFKKNYRQDKRKIKLYNKEITIKVTDEMVLDIISKLRIYSEYSNWFKENKSELINCFGDLYEEQYTNFSLINCRIIAFNALKNALKQLIDLKNIVYEVELKESILKSQYYFLYNGINTDWENIKKALIWALNFKILVKQYDINESFVELVCSDIDIIKLCHDYSIEIQSIIDSVDPEYKWFLKLFDNDECLKELNVSELKNKLDRCKDNLFLLEEWIDYRNIKNECCEFGLADYILKIEELQIDKNKIIPNFKKRFFRLWLDAILENYPAVLNFRRRIHENTIKNFAELDKLHFDISKNMIKSKLINGLPQINYFTRGNNEIGTLKNELRKQRKIMPIRKLFKAIPNLLLELKPCFMMSPLSVSLFLEADKYKFDTVIFDEASQICTENAIGAIFRGKQVIIAGDSKQLPPTNFFMASISDSEYDEEDESNDSDVYESILEEANLLPERTLRWHYRSRNESLIAFSNTKIYNNNLITFPSNKENTKDNGVEYIYVKDGIYDRGGKSGNINEAKKVAECVFEHFKLNPNRSLGVIAFGEIQQQAIDNQIRLMRLNNREYEKFFSEENNEPFFVKNLENVQGDERDTIIFSIGYAKNNAGTFYMNFGPLSKSGGERRLNVAITRAKYNIKLIGSILPTDINIDKITSEGPKLLREYIDFAMNGIGVLLKVEKESDTPWHDSDFEKSVYDFLSSKGYKLGTQVGCSGYRIDMAVKHPILSGIYVIGIECDGATYHSARTARERDRLRQDVLENMGWKIYRIWSTDWIKDPNAESKKLIKVIEDAISNYGISESNDLNQVETSLDSIFIQDNIEVTTLQAETPYFFEEYRETIFNVITYRPLFDSEIIDCVNKIINKEYPIHYELLCKRIAPFFNKEKVTIVVRRSVDNALNKLDKRIIRKDNFLLPSKVTKIIPRKRHNRNIDYISFMEIAEAMIMILPHIVKFGATKETLYAETLFAYGFTKSSEKIYDKMNMAFDLLIKQKRIKKENDILIRL